MIYYVMLWVARGYAVFFFALHLFLFIKYANEPAPVASHFGGSQTTTESVQTIQNSRSPSMSTGAMVTTYNYHGPTLHLALSVLFSAILTAGLFLLGRPLGWTLVVAPAFCLIAMAVYGTLNLILLVSHANHMKPSFYGELGKLVLGTASLVFIQLGNILLVVRVMRRAAPRGDSGYSPSLATRSF